MGRHAKFKAAQDAEKSGSRGCIIMALVPVALLAILMILINAGSPSLDQVRSQKRAEAAALDAVRKLLTDAGATSEITGAGVLVVTPPFKEALNMTAVAAKELALSTHQRTGGRVRVQTPAGQILAEAP